MTVSIGAGLAAVALAGAAASGPQPVALVYRGPAGCRGCSAPLARMLRSSPYRFRVRYVGPGEQLQLTASSFQGVSLYAQPGGGASVRKAYRSLGRPGRRAIVGFVRSGGRYLGTCMGGYLAGSDPGLGLLAPGDSREEILSPGASTTSTRAAVIPVTWGDRTVRMYFQDGARFLPSRRPGEMVLAHYTNGDIAALVTPVGAGRVAVVGPHPEAPRSWYHWEGLHDPDGTDEELGYELISVVMQ